MRRLAPQGGQGAALTRPGLDHQSRARLRRQLRPLHGDRVVVLPDQLLPLRPLSHDIIDLAQLQIERLRARVGERETVSVSVTGGRVGPPGKEPGKVGARGGPVKQTLI
jgi:hypothetical protein